MERMMSILGAKSGKEHLFIVRLAIVVSIGQIDQLLRMSNIGSAHTIRHYSTGYENLVVEHRRFVGDAI